MCAFVEVYPNQILDRNSKDSVQCGNNERIIGVDERLRTGYFASQGFA